MGASRSQTSRSSTTDSRAVNTALRRAADVVYAVSPLSTGAKPVPFSFDFSFNAYPLRYDRPGPQISIYRLKDCQ